MATATKFLPQIVRMADDRTPTGDWVSTKAGKPHPVFDVENPGSRSRGKSSRGKRKEGRKAASRLSLMIRMAEDAEPVVADVIPEDDYDSIDEILDMLEEFNIRLPDDTDDENLIERLRTALHTAMAHREDGEVEEEGEMLELPEAEEAPPVEETAQALSLATARAVAGQYRKSLGTRLKKLTDTGRCTPEEATAKRSELSTVKLSLAASGRPCKVEVDRWITSREAIPEGTFWTESQRLSLANHATAEDPEKLQALQKMIFRGR